MTDATALKIKSSFSMLEDLIEKNLDTIEAQRQNPGELLGLSTGFSFLDELTIGLHGSDLMVIASYPSVGKTAFALNIARNVAVLEQVPVAFVSLEMSKSMVSWRLLAAETKVEISTLQSGLIDHEAWQNLCDAAGILCETPIYIDDTPGMTVADIKAKFHKEVKDNALGLIIIDYLQLIRASDRVRQANDRPLEITEITYDLKMLAKELGIPIIILSQLNYPPEVCGDKRPALADLGDVRLEQIADIIVFLHRDEACNEKNSLPKGKTAITLAKNRNGPAGSSQLQFLEKFTKFE
ncbi:DnaB-like helicase C-terminal domain-containing protein [Desulfotignum phosphitoxidans]|uniref:Replicative DNA helicase DnaC n=1 Tax=Desulfotignum phosphitoxidans DSM 13687 TaxID=1286635 RepID=S0FUN7_9BACT|nr:DnaB-like helicase C-terminal domain-containing protein [Desulfotignum phosphitoxidans]EMS78425.1 replicative DNA helicase DnaC [Desulfotignum phosphitoxidans DSM 13687]